MLNMKAEAVRKKYFKDETQIFVRRLDDMKPPRGKEGEPRKRREVMRIRPQYTDATVQMKPCDNLFLDYYLRQNKDVDFVSKEAAAQEKSLYTFVTKLMDGSAMIDPTRAGVEDVEGAPQVDPKAERHARMLFESIVGGDDQVRPKDLGAFLKRLW